MIDLVASLAAFAIARCDALQVDVHHVGVAPLAVRAAVDARWEGDPCGPRPRLRLHLRDEDGRGTAMLVQPEQTVWVQGFEAPRAVPVDGEVTGRAARVALDPRHGRPVAVAGPWQARVPLRPGAVLTDQTVDPRPAARRGDDVAVVVQRGAVTLSVPGQLLTDGRTGGLVRVRHEASDRILQGRLVDPTTVEIP